MIAKLRSSRLGKAGMTAGAVILAIVALDLIASAATLALGWELMKR